MRDHYYFGDAAYNAQLCWPGYTPLSKLDEYPNNPVYAIYSAWVLYEKYIANQAILRAPNLFSAEGV